MYFARVFTVDASGNRRGVFRCERCTFVAPVSVNVKAQGQGRAHFFFGQDDAKKTAAERAEKAAERAANGLLNLFACPLCRRRRSYARLAIHCLVWAAALFWPATFAALVVVFVGGSWLHVLKPRDIDLPFLVTGLLVALALVATVIWRWNKAIRESEAVKLRRFWEWQLPSGPRVVAVQDPASGTDAVWVDAARIAATDDDYLIPLRPSTADGPYREQALQAHVRFPVDGTCWLMVGGKRVEPVRTSSDVV